MKHVRSIRYFFESCYGTSAWDRKMNVLKQRGVSLYQYEGQRQLEKT